MNFVVLLGKRVTGTFIYKGMTRFKKNKVFKNDTLSN